MNIQQINDEISSTARKASLVILLDSDTVEIKHKIHLFNKSILGILIFLCGGIFISVIPFIKSSDWISKIFGLLIGLTMLLLSIATLIRQRADGLKITKKEITTCYNLRRKIIPVNNLMKVVMRLETMRVSRVGAFGTDFIIISHFLKDGIQEVPILKFEMTKANTDEAIALGKEITRILNKKLSDSSIN